MAGIRPKGRRLRHHPAASDLGRARTILQRRTWAAQSPDTTLNPLWGIPKTEKRLGLQLFCDWGLSWTPPIADLDAKAQIISCTAAYFRFRGAEKSPLSQKSCKNGGIFVFRWTDCRNRADPTKPIHPYGANPAKNVQSHSGNNGPKPAKEGYGQERV